MRWLGRLADAARHRARSRQWAPDAAAGRRGEDLAHRYLEKLGYVVVARNWRGAGGEIDLVAWDREKLVFVEVKTRATDEFGDPARNIDEAKQRALMRAAREYARRAGVSWDAVRFDIVTVLLAGRAEVNVMQDVFQVSRTL